MAKKPGRKREYTESQKLTFWFVSDVLGQSPNSKFVSRYFRESKLLLTPKDGESPLAPEFVRGTILALKLGMFGFYGEIETLWIVTYGKPPYYTQFEEYAKSPPPVDNLPEIRQWEELTGKVAYPKSDAIMDFVPPALPKEPDKIHSDYWGELHE